MRRLFLAGSLFLTGCCNVVGPLDYRTPQRPDDPCVSIPEQEVRGRDRLPLWDESTVKMKNLAPRTYVDRPSPTGW
jgi:hypothetical protein